MKKFLIAALISINLALVALLAFHVTAPPAQAELRNVTGDQYSVMTVRIGNQGDAVVILDLKTDRMAAFSFDQTAKRLTPFFGRDLKRDFGAAR